MKKISSLRMDYYDDFMDRVEKARGNQAISVADSLLLEILCIMTQELEKIRRELERMEI